MSYARSAIIETERKKEGPRDQTAGAVLLSFANPFRKTNLPVTHLNGRIYKHQKSQRRKYT
jgi:hypothetical protein